MAAALADSVQEVLEKMFFVDVVDPAGADSGMPHDMRARVVFDGDPPGTFWLAVDIAAVRSAAADFLGEDPDCLTEEQLEGVVCELANMICGSVLSRVESSAVFRLAKPELAAPEPHFPAAAAQASFQAMVGGGLLRAEIHMERPACPGIDEHES